MTRLSDPLSSSYLEELICQAASTGFPVEIYNRPGLPAILYRCGTHSQFKHFMLSRLSAGNRAALNALTTRADDDFTIALLDALAVMSDALTFYQERIAQESYLRTATERFSITHMARFVGYKPKTGLAAATCLAFTLDSSPGSPQTVNIPERTQAQSIPKEQDKLQQDKLPQTFETTEPLTARVEWNELRPRMTTSQTVSLSSGEVFLQRANLNLQTGDVLLFIDKSAETPANKNWNIVRITKSEPQPQFERTKVSWFWAGEEQKVSNKSEEANVYVFREHANIFGYNAPEWGALPDVAKATYLGITDPAELTAEELWEWPQFFVQAPEFPIKYLDSGKPTREVAPTPESVAASVTAVAKASTDALQGMALSSIPNAAIQVIQAITIILDSLLGVANHFRNTIISNTDESNTALENLTASLGELLTSLVSFDGLGEWLRVKRENDQDIIQYSNDGGNNWHNFNNFIDLSQWLGFINALIGMFERIKSFSPTLDQTKLDDIANKFANLVKSLPVLAPYQAVVDIFDPENSDNPISTMGDAINNAAAAVAKVPESLAKALGGHIVAKVVTLAVQAIMEMPIVKTDDVDFETLEGLDDVDISQLENARLSLTPELVAFTAVVSAKMAVAILAGTDITDPKNLFNTIFTSTWEGTVDDNGQPTLDDEIGLEHLATGILGVTIVGSGAYIAANTLMLAFVWPTIIPIIIPIVVGYFIFASTLGDDVFEGAIETQIWIRKVVKAALNARKEDLSPRKELKKLSLNQIDLDKIYSKVTPNSWLLLSLPQTRALYRLTDVAEASRSDFTLNAKVTRVMLDNADFGSKADPNAENVFRREVRMTAVFANSEKLEFSEAPDTSPVSVGLEGSSVTLDRRMPDLEIGRRLIMTGLSADGEPKPLIDLLILREQSIDGDYSKLVFVSLGDEHRYQRDSVRIFANVAPATHGATVDEVLGSGDAAQALQTFKLRQPPVTYVASSAETGSTSTLEVWVNDVLWEEVPFLHGIGPRRRAYSTEIDDSGQTMLRFGDGLDGARPHTGLENIRARYRSGIGKAGNVDAGDISLLTKRPLGVVNVTNPLQAVSGSDPEPTANIRSNIPADTRHLDRIVSLRDYADFAAAYPDVYKARAVQQGYGPDRKILVTVAGDDGAQIDVERLDHLLAAMRIKGDAGIPIEVQNYDKVQFVLAAQITYENAYLGDKVADGVCAALEKHFAFDSRQFGQPVTLMEIMALIQSVAGVAGVDIDQLCRTDQAIQTGPPETPTGLTIVSEENTSVSSSAAADISAEASKISIICTYSANDYNAIDYKCPDDPNEYLRVSPQELLLPKKITLLFQTDTEATGYEF